MAAGRHLGFDVTRNSAIRKFYLEPNMKCRITRCGDMAIREYWGHMEPPFWWEGEVVGISDGTIRKSDGGFL